jgi:hypothetical protein
MRHPERSEAKGLLSSPGESERSRRTLWFSRYITEAELARFRKARPPLCRGDSLRHNAPLRRCSPGPSTPARRNTPAKYTCRSPSLRMTELFGEVALSQKSHVVRVPVELFHANGKYRKLPLNHGSIETVWSPPVACGHPENELSGPPELKRSMTGRRPCGGLIRSLFPVSYCLFLRRARL